ncbi:unnamed protein product [Cylicocyclus nassatus]|uniref:C-type lectin domain-containing protein n=1 Tax=Cylicocyclus nassatus TaxID=53992 RepID=A0AA36GTE7_CYLNA|nr:unnamed protein product [Cylicocyclus nassatus]
MLAWICALLAIGLTSAQFFFAVDGQAALEERLNSLTSHVQDLDKQVATLQKKVAGLAQAAHSEWNSTDSGSLYRVFEERRSWSDAENLCQTFDAHLAVIDNETKNNFVKGLINEKPTVDYVWIGMKTKSTSPSSQNTFTNFDKENPISDYNYALIIFSNKNLSKIFFSNKLIAQPKDFFVRMNPKLMPKNIFNAPYAISLGNKTDCLIHEARRSKSCSKIIGDVDFKSLPSNIWTQVHEVEGTLRIENTKLTNLDAIRGLKIIGWKVPALIIKNNLKLNDISALLSISIKSKKPEIEIENNPSICHNITDQQKLKKWLLLRKASVKFNSSC